MSGGRPKLCAVCGKEIGATHSPSCRVYEAAHLQRMRSRVLEDRFVFIEPIGKKPLPDEPPEIVN